jgi:hypothetical protein
MTIPLCAVVTLGSRSTEIRCYSRNLACFFGRWRRRLLLEGLRHHLWGGQQHRPDQSRKNQTMA